MRWTVASALVFAVALAVVMWWLSKP